MTKNYEEAKRMMNAPLRKMVVDNTDRVKVEIDRLADTLAQLVSTDVVTADEAVRVIGHLQSKLSSVLETLSDEVELRKDLMGQ